MDWAVKTACTRAYRAQGRCMGLLRLTSSCFSACSTACSATALTANFCTCLAATAADPASRGCSQYLLLRLNTPTSFGVVVALLWVIGQLWRTRVLVCRLPIIVCLGTRSTCVGNANINENNVSKHFLMKIHCCVLHVADAVAMSSTPDNEARLNNASAIPIQRQKDFLSHLEVPARSQSVVDLTDPSQCRDNNKSN